MKTKICSKCGVEKPISEFEKASTGKHGVRGDCKECVKERQKNRYKNNKEEILKYAKIYRDNNREKIVKSNQNWYLNNKEEILEKRKEYQKDNKEKILEQKKIYNKQRRKEDIQYKIKGNLRKRIWDALKGNNKSPAPLG